MGLDIEGGGGSHGKMPLNLGSDSKRGIIGLGLEAVSPLDSLPMFLGHAFGHPTQSKQDHYRIESQAKCRMHTIPERLCYACPKVPSSQLALQPNTMQILNRTKSCQEKQKDRGHPRPVCMHHRHPAKFRVPTRATTVTTKRGISP